MKSYKFKLKNKYSNYLSLIFKNLNSEKYIWNLENDEIFTNENQFLFNQENIENNDFWEIINNNQNYYIVFGNIKLYKNKEDLKKDKWIVYLKIVDCELAEIFVGDDEYLKIIEKNLDSLNKSIK